MRLTEITRIAVILMALGLALVIFEKMNGQIMGKLKGELPGKIRP